MSPFELLKGEKVLSHCQYQYEILWILERLSLLQGKHIFLSQSIFDHGYQSRMSSKIHGYPINVLFLPEGSILEFFSLVTLKYTGHPNILKCSISGFTLVKASLGFIFFKV
jgi:hypothetical protein